ncbi:MAG: histidine phosphatase family protein [Bacillota bacterium]|nr:histidine phosphatase family protein [Bacillota bacterium]
MELLLIRHGQSEADLLGVHEGKADFPLTELGQRQAKKMAHYVTQFFPPDLIVTSPLIRAKHTALLLQNSVGCELLEENDLKEYDNGVLAGLTKEAAAIQYPLPKNGRPFHIPIQEGESELEFRFRAERIFHKIMSDYHHCNRIAIVSHGGLISNLLKAFLKLPNTHEFAFPTGDTGIHLLEIKETVRVVKFLNRQEHLL